MAARNVCSVNFKLFEKLSKNLTVGNVEGGDLHEESHGRAEL